MMDHRGGEDNKLTGKSIKIIAAYLKIA